MKAIIIAVACLLGALYLVNTPDKIQTGATSVEGQIIENNHKEPLREMGEDFAHIPETVSNVKSEAEARQQQFKSKRAEIDARSNRAEIEADRAKMKQEQAEFEAVWGKEKPREYK